jgi:hypothetical protein
VHLRDKKIKMKFLLDYFLRGFSLKSLFGPGTLTTVLDVIS